MEFGFNQSAVRVKDSKYGGGVLADLGCYGIQLVQSVMKDKPEKIVATGVVNEMGEQDF